MASLQSRIDWRTTTFKPNASLYGAIEKIVTTAPEPKDLQALTAGSMAFAMQPISSSAVLAGQAAGSTKNQTGTGGNALGLDAVDQTWLLLESGWWSADGDARAHNATRGILDRIEAASRTSGDYVPYLFMNDASWDQDVIAHYGAANVARLKDVQKRYDPNQVFQKLVPGGFKLPA